jgi:type II secretory ATPase GspE/PulE/Tfp pilus assembly ATPase PilB-like protein
VIKALGVSQESIQGITFYKAVGCDQCSQVGYKGRMPIFEIMQMTGALAHLITQKVDAHVLLQQALKDGMIMLVYDGLDKIKQGLTTVDEVLAVATAQE